MQLTFLGAAGEVTGSCTLVETGATRFLVDCGMFQGGHEADLKNQRFPLFDPASIDFILLTHAHIDHSGMLPRLAARGFSGPIYATLATIELLDVMLRDSAHIQAKEAEWEERHPHRNGHDEPSPPLYSLLDVEKALALLQPVEYASQFGPRAGVVCCFLDAGHILGSAIIEVWLGEDGDRRKIVFSGDIGQPGRPILRSPTPVDSADILLVESTYGNRLHKNLDDTLDEFVRAIERTLLEKHGNVIMPAFTVGRTQEILYLLIDLTRQRRLHNLKIYVDSPLALAATEITMHHIELFNQEARKLLTWGEERRKELPDIRFTQTVEESMALNDIKSGAIIISASGMCDAGRIKHHLRYNLNRPQSSIIFTGFQAEGTLGRRLVDGAKLARIFGEEIVVRADIYTIGGLSAHADQAGLLEWLGYFKHTPRQTFVVHGESATAEQFAGLIRSRLGWNARTPEMGEKTTI
ncbi:MAG TPA: MBL fold metallo-hydrolase [Methylophilaceae bacterium]|nr:MBL fold metallo-hydrolase [Methylophilaceae bacterium]HQR61125.1 MBL fold metallo-hydrolase [Methylophilaceae bacterium]